MLGPVIVSLVSTGHWQFLGPMNPMLINFVSAGNCLVSCSFLLRALVRKNSGLLDNSVGVTSHRSPRVSTCPLHFCGPDLAIARPGPSVQLAALLLLGLDEDRGRDRLVLDHILYAHTQSEQSRGEWSTLPS